MDAKFINKLQKQIASRSVGASTARGMGPKGTVASARRYLANLDLYHVRNLKNYGEFKAWLDEKTNDFMSHLPEGGRHWGSARKFLNIFLSGVVFNRYLFDAFDLSHCESWLEVPLDKHVANALREEKPEGADLPRWKTVVGLEPSKSEQFQDVASKVSGRKDVARVHLDVFYWRRNEQLT